MKKNSPSRIALLLAVLSLATLPGCAGKQAAVKDTAPLATAEPAVEPAIAVQDAAKDSAEPGTTGAITAGRGDTTPISGGPLATDVAGVQGALQTVYFNFDSAELSTEARDSLARNFQSLNKKQAQVVVEGHCDERGSSDYNLALGEKRARAAYNYLISLGVPEERLSTISYGEEKPAVAGDDESAWSKNRRADFVLK